MCVCVCEIESISLRWWCLCEGAWHKDVRLVACDFFITGKCACTEVLPYSSDLSIHTRSLAHFTE